MTLQKTPLVLLTLCACFSLAFGQYHFPVDSDHLSLSSIGEFGLQRKARPEVPAHLHTGIDITRPCDYSQDCPIYPIAEGIVISIRKDGPFAQIIIAHDLLLPPIWSVYEHIADIEVALYQEVTAGDRIARFFKPEELNQIGWQFDHFHLEILKTEPYPLKQDPAHPERKFASYTLICHSFEQLNQYFYNPLAFLNRNVNP